VRYRGRPGPTLTADATPLRLPPGETYNPNEPYTFQSEGRGIATWFSRGYDPQGKFWGDKPKDDKPQSNQLGVPDPYQGISLSNPATVGEFFYVKDPNTGLTHVIQQSESGPGIRTQAFLDVAVPKLSQMGYTQKSFEALTEKRLWDVTPTGFGTGQVEKRYDPSGRQRILPGTEDPSWKGRGGAFEEEGTPASLLEAMGLKKPGGRDPTMEQLPNMQVAQRDIEQERGRRQLDRDMGDQLDVSGKLNVSVNAPAGTDVKASGDGMFKDNVSLDRSLPLVI
jgi:hypothetical protein